MSLTASLVTRATSVCEPEGEAEVAVAEPEGEKTAEVEASAEVEVDAETAAVPDEAAPEEAPK